MEIVKKVGQKEKGQEGERTGMLGTQAFIEQQFDSTLLWACHCKARQCP